MFSPAFPSYKSPMANLMGLRWIATGVPAEEIDKSLKPGDLPLLKRTADAYVYENKDAFRASCCRAGRWRRISARSSNRAACRTSITGKTCCSTAPHAPPSRRCNAPGRRARPRPAWRRSCAMKIPQIDVEAQAPAKGGFLVLNDVWQDWQSATVDGRPAPVLRANLMFRAVFLAPGAHRVRFRFEPSKGLMQFLPARLFRARKAGRWRGRGVSRPRQSCRQRDANGRVIVPFAPAATNCPGRESGSMFSRPRKQTR